MSCVAPELENERKQARRNMSEQGRQLHLLTCCPGIGQLTWVEVRRKFGNISLPQREAACSNVCFGWRTMAISSCRVERGGSVLAVLC